MRDKLTDADMLQPGAASSITDGRTQPIERAAILVKNGFAAERDSRERSMEIADRVFRTRDVDERTDTPNRSNPRYQNLCNKVEALILDSFSSA